MIHRHFWHDFFLIIYDTLPLKGLNLITSTPISGNLNKTYLIRKEVDLKQELFNSIKEYREIAINQLKIKSLEKIANAYIRSNNERTDLTFKETAPQESSGNQSNGEHTRRSTYDICDAERTMDDNNNDSNRKNVLKKEEDRLLEKAIITANKKAIERLRLQRIVLLKECVISSSDEDVEEEKLDVEKLDRVARGSK